MILNFIFRGWNFPTISCVMQTVYTQLCATSKRYTFVVFFNLKNRCTLHHKKTFFLNRKSDKQGVLYYLYIHNPRPRPFSIITLNIYKIRALKWKFIRVYIPSTTAKRNLFYFFFRFNSFEFKETMKNEKKKNKVALLLYVAHVVFCCCFLLCGYILVFAMHRI